MLQVAVVEGDTFQTHMLHIQTRIYFTLGLALIKILIDHARGKRIATKP